jgi:hypothetical protein
MAAPVLIADDDPDQEFLDWLQSTLPTDGPDDHDPPRPTAPAPSREPRR